MFNLGAKDKYGELPNLKLDISSMLQNYNFDQREKVSVLKNWLGRESLQLITTLTQEQQEACNNKTNVLNTLNRKFKPQYNETITSL